MCGDYNLLKDIANSESWGVYSANKKRDIWKNDPFQFVFNFPSRSRGKFGENLLSAFLTRKGCTVDRPTNTDYDLLLNKKYKCEVKFSTLWQTGKYVFQQIRDQDWDFLLCLGISPNATANFWYARKDIYKELRGQHTGGKGLETKWIHIRPNDSFEKLQGGDLSVGVKGFLTEIGR